MATLKAGLQGHIIVCGFGNTGTATGRDDASALILLTARHLNPTIRIIVREAPTASSLPPRSVAMLWPPSSISPT